MSFGEATLQLAPQPSIPHLSCTAAISWPEYFRSPASPPIAVGMTRATVGLPALLIALALGGYLYAKDAKTNGPTSPTVTQAVAQAQSSVAATNFEQADAAMQGFFAQNGTYAGATLPPGTGVVLVRSDGSSYCLQGGSEHENGPGGRPQPGPC